MSAPRRARLVADITWLELRRIVRDRTALFFLLVLPVVIIVIIGTAIFASQSLRVGVVNASGGEVAAAILERLDDPGGFEVELEDSVDEIERQVRRGRFQIGVVLPADLEAQVAAGEPATIRLVLDPTSDSAFAARTTVTNVVADVGEQLAAARFTSTETGRRPDDAAALVARAAELLEPVTVEVDVLGVRRESADSRYGYTAPSNLVLFTFITALSGGAALIESRRQGVVRRMLAAPATPGMVVLGLAASRLALALVQALLLLGVGALIFGVSWGDPVGVALLLFVFALVATGAGLVAGAVFSNAEQVQAVGVPVGIGMGMLGGCMWPLEIVGDSMRTVGHLVPHAWAMDGWIELVFEGGGVAAIAGDLAVLSVYAAVLLALAARSLRKMALSG